MYAQSATKHKEYFEFVYNIFIPFCTKNHVPQFRIIRDSRNNKIYTAMSFTTMQLPCFNVFKEIFYLSNKKVVPNNIHDLLTFRALAF